MKKVARILPICSGSSGNCTYISSGGCAILVDAGASFKNIAAAVNSVGDMAAVRAVAITHAHSDHIKGLKTLVKNTGLPVIATKKTLEILIRENCLDSHARVICTDGCDGVPVGDGMLNAFETSHDIEGSCGYTLSLPDGQRVGICTDLGTVTDTVRNAVSGCAALLIESNHDINMLRRGPYPPQLKLRILSDRGHLSNNACAAELVQLFKGGTTRFILGHLSLHNNMPMLALSAARAALEEAGAKGGTDYILTVAKPGVSGVTVL